MSLGYVHIGKYRRPARRITSLKVDEVSSVDRAANPHARVLLTKRWDGRGQLGDRGFIYSNERTASMQPMTMQEQIAKSITDRNTGRLSDADVAKQHQTWALEMFPQSESIGKALNSFYGTHLGKAALGTATMIKYAEVQKAGKLGDAYDVLLKRSGQTDETLADQDLRNKTISTDDDDDDILGDGRNPYHAALEGLANHLLESGQVKGSKEQAYAHMATKTTVGQKLMAHATAWDLRRKARAGGAG